VADESILERQADRASSPSEPPSSGGERRALTDEFQLALDALPGLVWTMRPDGSADFLNQRWREYTGLSLAESVGWGWATAVSPDDRPGFLETWKRVLSSGAPGEAIARLRRADGDDRWFMFRAVPRYEHGALCTWYGQTIDIHERVRAEALLAGEKRLLEMLAKGIVLPVILEALCILSEELTGGYMVSILLLDLVGRRVLHAAAPNLPPGFAQTLNSSIVDPRAGPCALAAFSGEPVLIPDFVVEPRWPEYRALAMSHGLRSCWSNPIRSLSGTVLGTLAFYSRTPQVPTAEQRGVVEQMVSLASVAVERGRAEEALRRSEAYQAEAQRLSLTGSFSRHIVSGEMTWSDETYRIYGFDRSLRPSLELMRQRVHPDDAALFGAMEAAMSQDGKDRRFGHRLVMPDGAIKYVQIVSTAVRDAAGEVVECIGAIHDGTERHIAERALRHARMRALETRYGAMMEERTRIAREIHDTVLQGFNGVALMLMAAAGTVTSPPAAVDALQHVLDLAEKALGDARRAVWDLRTPAVGDDFATSLRTCVEDVVRGTGLALDFQTTGSVRRLDAVSQAVALRVAQEAITNAVKHACARRVRVRVSYGTRRVRLSVRDDGHGFAVDPDFRAYGGHWGLLGMRERATQVGGRLTVRSTIGVGTTITLLLP
jgi:PAS domain S-box-containing protein